MIQTNYIQNIVNGCKKKHSKSQRAMVDTFSGYLFVVCMRYMGNQEDAKDCLQKSFIRIFEKIEQFDYDKGQFKSWITKITINICLSEKRTQKVYLDIEDINQNEQIDSSDVLDFMANDEILEMVAKLPDKYRQVFNLIVIDRYQHAEVAEMLGIDLLNSRKRLSRAKTILQNQLLKIKNKEQWLNQA